MYILKISDVIKSYSKHKVLDSVNINIDSPDIYALIGPNGSGKITLFNIISNLISPDSGEVHVLGKNNTDESIFYETYFLKDNIVLYDYLTGMDHIMFIKNSQKISNQKLEERKFGNKIICK